MASLRSFNNTRMHDLITCSVCLEVLTEPKVLPCLHSFCSHCLHGMWTQWDRHITCPVCKDTSKMPSRGVKGLKNDFKAEQLKELLEVEAKEVSNTRAQHEDGVLGLIENLCEVCKFQPAKLHCAECSVYYCRKCITKHERNALFKTHQVVQLQTEASTRGVLSISFCSVHQGHRVKFLCMTCKPQATLCPICVLQHNVATHDICDIADATVHFRRKLKTDLKSVHSKMAFLRKRKNAVDDTKVVQAQLLSELHEAICLQALLVVAKVEDNKTRMLQDLQNMVMTLVSDLHEEQLDDQLNELTCLESELLGAIDDTSQNCFSGYEQLSERLLLVKKLSISDVETDGKRLIQFAPNKEDLDHDVVGRLEYITQPNPEKECRKTRSERTSSIVKTERSEVLARCPSMEADRPKITRRILQRSDPEEDQHQPEPHVENQDINIEITVDKADNTTEEDEIHDAVFEGGVPKLCPRRRGGNCEACDQRTAALISFYSKKKERIQKLCRHCRALSDVHEDMK